MRIILRNIFTMFILLGAASNVCAALIIENDQLIGATNVDVDGTLYNVEFIDGSCMSLFDGCDDSSDFQFNTSGSAYRASAAILALLSDNPIFNKTPALIRGCESAQVCKIRTNFVYNSKVAASDAANDASFGWNFIEADFGIDTSIDLRGDSMRTYARWTEATSVPEPSTMVIWGLGLIGLASRRFKKQS